jgi:hypothetical protein
LATALSGTNSWTERDSVLNSFKAILSVKNKLWGGKEKGNSTTENNELHASAKLNSGKPIPAVSGRQEGIRHGTQSRLSVRSEIQV